MKNYAGWIMGILFFTVLIRVMYAMHSPLYMTTGDSVSYFLTGKQIVETKKIVDPWRTPVYPILLAIPYIVSNSPMPEEISGVYTFGLYAVRIAQSIVMIVGAIVLFFVCLQLGIGKLSSFLLAIVGTSDYVLLLLEHTILTEAIAFFWLVCIMFVMMRLLKSFSIPSLGLLVFLWIFGVFLRPSMIAIPFICSLILLLRYRTLHMILYSLLSLVLYCGVIMGYANVNLNDSGFYGITRIQYVNIWGKLLQMNVSDQSLGQSEIAQKARAARLVNAKHPFEVFRQFPELYGREHINAFNTFTLDALRKNSSHYILSSLQSIPQVISSPTDLVDITATTGVFDTFFRALESVYELLMNLAYIPLLFYPFVFVTALKKKSVQSYGLLLIASVCLYHIFVYAFLTYDDFGRFMSNSRPFVLIAIYGIWRELKYTVA